MELKNIQIANFKSIENITIPIEIKGRGKRKAYTNILVGLNESGKSNILEAIKLFSEKFKGIIISPGPSSPDNSGNTLKYLKNYLGKIPFLGVCLGMQAIGYVLGFNIINSKTILHTN